MRSSFVCACAILQGHPHAAVQADAVHCLQQLHMFSQGLVDLAVLVPWLCRAGLHPAAHLRLRQASVACLRQFAQREAREMCEHAMALIDRQSVKDTHSLEALNFTETGELQRKTKQNLVFA